MDPQPKLSFTYTLTQAQQDILTAILFTGNYKQTNVPYTTISVTGDHLTVNLYQSGKCCIQGKNAESFVLYVLEPNVLGAASVGYESVLDPPKPIEPHMGSDESGKGDFFGPLCICAAYVDASLGEQLRKANIKDCKLLSDKQVRVAAAQARKILTPKHFKVVTVGPQAYNRLYAKIGNLNNLLAWGHARALEDLLTDVPDCPYAVVDQFGKTPAVIERALLKKMRGISVRQMHKAESDLAVATASVLARDAFLYGLERMGTEHDVTIPKGVSAEVLKVATQIVKAKGPEALTTVAKCHFSTADKVLEATGYTRADLGELGQARSRPKPPPTA